MFCLPRSSRCIGMRFPFPNVWTNGSLQARHGPIMSVADVIDPGPRFRDAVSKNYIGSEGLNWLIAGTGDALDIALDRNGCGLLSW